MGTRVCRTLLAHYNRAMDFFFFLRSDGITKKKSLLKNLLILNARKGEKRFLYLISTHYVRFLLEYLYFIFQIYEEHDHG